MHKILHFTLWFCGLHMLLVHATTAQHSKRAILNTNFFSARTVNVCSEKDGGYGPGRVHYKTESCVCLDERRFRAICTPVLPTRRPDITVRYDRHCDPRNEEILCLPSNGMNEAPEDCACLPTVHKTGTKPPHDKDGIACSGGLFFGRPYNAGGVQSVRTYSTITTTSDHGLQGCWVQDSKGRSIEESYPCDSGVGHKISLAIRETYQACIEANDDTPERIGFDWFIGSPLGKRDSPGLAEEWANSFDYDPSMAHSKWQGDIVLVDHEGNEVRRLKGK